MEEEKVLYWLIQNKDFCNLFLENKQDKITSRIRSLKNRHKILYEKLRECIDTKIKVKNIELIQVKLDELEKLGIKVKRMYSLIVGDHLSDFSPLDKDSPEGFSKNDIQYLSQKYNGKIYNLSDFCLEKYQTDKIKEASVVVFQNGLHRLFNLDENIIKNECDSIKYDDKELRYGKVINKKARYNIVFGKEDKSAEFKNGKGTIVALNRVPTISQFNENCKQFFKKEKEKEKIEYNIESINYYDTETCFLGFHGDSERKRVIVCRIGENMPLYFEWYYKGKCISERIKIELNSGDIYILSEKACGTDWKMHSQVTLRHAVGNNI